MDEVMNKVLTNKNTPTDKQIKKNYNLNFVISI
jgi:hypothetical protein